MPAIPVTDIKKVATLGTYMPRRCGIAAFTTDLANALDAELGGQGETYAVAMDDVPEGYRYPDTMVRW